MNRPNVIEPLSYPVGFEQIQERSLTLQSMGLDAKFFERLHNYRDPYPTATEYRIRWSDWCASLRKRYGP